MAADFLRVERLTKSFGNTDVVSEVSFRVRRQEIFGLLGPNGAGKTTTIRMLATVLKPTAGEATLGEHSLTGAGAAVRRLIGVCPQELALYPELSALDNLVFFGRMAGLAGAEAKAAAQRNLQIVGLQEVGGRRVQNFSGGMKRRVNLAISLMSQPQLLFLDEPTVGIDPQSRNRIFETVEGLRDEGMTILYTTHYMEEAERLCDRLGIMDQGRLIALGSPQELKATIGDPDEVTLEQVFLELTGRTLRDTA